TRFECALLAVFSLFRLLNAAGTDIDSPITPCFEEKNHRVPYTCSKEKACWWYKGERSKDSEAKRVCNPSKVKRFCFQPA
ncbi:hypothetical protein COLO4_03120, partial [Corchorus olitorius]